VVQVAVYAIAGISGTLAEERREFNTVDQR